MNITRNALLFFPALSTLVLANTASAQLRDLVVANLQVSPQAILAGQTVRCDITIANNGLQQAARNRAEIRLDAGTQLIVLGDFEVPFLDPNRTFSTTAYVQVPASTAASGTHHIQCEVDVDGVVQELRENNNITSEPVTLIPSVDLTVDSIQTTGTAWERGQSYSFTPRIRNLGAVDSGAFTLGLYVSTNSTITTNDRLLATQSYTNITAGNSTSRRFTLTLPGDWPLGPCYIGCIVDSANVVVEGDEDNNTFATAGVHGLTGTAVIHGTGCAGSAAWPSLRSLLQPTENGIGRFEVVRTVPNSLVFFAFGFSDTQSSAGPLPYDLGPLGAAGCMVRVSPDVVLWTTSDPTGSAPQQILYPANTAGFTLYTQALISDPVNNLGLVTSNSLEITIGS